MLKDFSKGKRTFYISSEAWFSRERFDRNTSKIAAEIMVSVDAPGGGTLGEFGIRWHTFPHYEKTVPRLEVFDDGWASLASMPDLIAALGTLDNTNPQPAEIAALLLSLGFTDVTPREEP